jgi:hypothetical protein
MRNALSWAHGAKCPELLGERGNLGYLSPVRSVTALEAAAWIAVQLRPH